MANNVRELLQEYDDMKYATENGLMRHAQMQSVRMGDSGLCGDDEIIAIIKSHPELAKFFVKNSRAEVPVAGIVRGKFISRRIDRLVVETDTKQVLILDYKTDVDKKSLRDKYLYQLSEYKELLKQVYPDYTIKAYILWLHDWELELV